MTKTAGIFLVALLMVTGCASEDSPTDDREGPEIAAEETATGTEAGRDDQKKKKRAGQGTRGVGSPKKTPGDGDGAGDGAGTEGGGGTAADRGGGGSTGGGAGSGQPYPAPGNYRFAQSGYEEFCDQAGRCDKESLPARQPVTVAYESRTNDSAMVVTEQEASNSRTARTWTRFTPAEAEITKLYIRFEYSGFRFERTYTPRPPVEALRFPLTGGEAWSGRWQASTSGSYSARVGSPRRIVVNGRSVLAYPVETTTKFRGDFEGRSRITAYVDDNSKAIVATEGVLNVTSQFGRYTTVFETKLVQGPGY